MVRLRRRHRRARLTAVVAIAPTSPRRGMYERNARSRLERTPFPQGNVMFSTGLATFSERTDALSQRGALRDRWVQLADAAMVVDTASAQWRARSGGDR